MLHTDEDVKVGPADYGLGVFAECRFGPHALVGPIAGSVVDDPDYESDYCMDLGGDLSLEPSFPFRYINHSCRPNCALVHLDVEYGRQKVVRELWLEIRAEVALGEQMTIDYGWPAAKAERCLCGSSDCRGWIVAAGELDQIQGERAGLVGQSPRA